MMRLGLRLPLIEGEMPTSLVSRLARLHGTNPRDFCSDLGLQWPHICSAHPEQLSRLAKLADVSLPQLIRWSGPFVSPCRYRVGSEIASTGVFRRAVTRICPRCVLEAKSAGLHHGPFQRLDWLVLSIHVCSEHGTALLKLPNAGHAHDTYDLLAQIERHHDAIRQAAEADAFMPVTPFENYVLRRIRGRALPDWMSALELQHVHRGCLALGSALLFGAGQNSAALDTMQGRAALDRGYSVLQGGPSHLSAALSQLKAAYQTERPYFSTDMGGFYTWLKDEAREPLLEDMRRVVRAFIIESYPIRPGHLVLGEATSQAVRLTFADARQASGIARARMATTLRHLRDERQDGTAHITDVSAGDIKAVAEFWANLSNLKDAADILGVHPAQMKGLIAADVLQAVRLKSALRYVTRASIEGVLRMIDALPISNSSTELLPIAEFSQSRCVSMARILKAVQDCEISGAYRRDDATGIRSILIDNGEMPVRARRRHHVDMSIAEAAEHLRIGASGIRELRDCGYLEQVHRRNPDTNHQRAFITISSIAQFEAEYETLGQIAARIGMSPMHLAKRLDEYGVDPLPTRRRLVRAYARNLFPQGMRGGVHNGAIRSGELL